MLFGTCSLCFPFVFHHAGSSVLHLAGTAKCADSGPEEMAKHGTLMCLNNLAARSHFTSVAHI